MTNILKCSYCIKEDETLQLLFVSLMNTPEPAAAAAEPEAPPATEDEVPPAAAVEEERMESVEQAVADGEEQQEDVEQCNSPFDSSPYIFIFWLKHKFLGNANKKAKLDYQDSNDGSENKEEDGSLGENRDEPDSSSSSQSDQQTDPPSLQYQTHQQSISDLFSALFSSGYAKHQTIKKL